MRGSDPELSIGIATLYRPDYLFEAVASVVSAARQASCQIELVVSDMGGACETIEAIREASEGSPPNLRIITLSNKSIQSGIANWRNCLAHARGKYYMMIGDDDRVSPGGLTALCRHIGGGDAPAAFLGPTQDIDAAGRIIRTKRRRMKTVPGTALLAAIALRKESIRWCAFVAQTHRLRALRVFEYDFPGGGGAADGAAIYAAAMGGDVTLLSTPVAQFRVHASNDSRVVDVAYQERQRDEFLRFVGRSVSDPWLTNVARFWCATGVYFQVARWTTSRRLGVHEYELLMRLAARYAREIDWAELGTAFRWRYPAFLAVGVMSGAILRVQHVASRDGGREP